MTGNELRALRLSLGLTVAQAAMLCVADYYIVLMWEREWPEGEEVNTEEYEAYLKRWQAAGERKDTEQ